MNAWLNYIIEANIGLLFLLAIYRLLLRNETNFRLVRVVLLTGIAASIMFPLLHFEDASAAAPLSVGGVLPSYWLPETSTTSEAAPERDLSAGNVWQYASTIYLIGFVTCLGWVSVQLARLLIMLRRAKTYRIQRLRIAESNEDKPVFSFFNFIFIGRAHMLSTQDKQQIILHERVHAQRWHSFDIVLINILWVCFWFNPFIRAYKKTFIQLHEFEADARAVEGTDVNKYCSLLARVALESTGFSLANHFSNSLTVKRIEMMRAIKNNMSPWKIAVSTLTIPAIFFFVSCQDQVTGTQADSSESPVVIDEHAYPEGGLEAFYSNVRRNMRYPASARSEHKYGRVLIQFLVNKDGSLSDIEFLDNPDATLAEEVKRVLSLTSRWVPARSGGLSVSERMVLPVNFLLDIPGQGMAGPKNNVTVEANKSSLNEIVVVGYAK